MTVLKWLLIVVSVGYVGGLAGMFLLQRSFLFPIPQVGRTTPDNIVRRQHQTFLKEVFGTHNRSQCGLTST